MFSSLNACNFCYGSHKAIAIDLDVDPDLLEAITQDIATAPIEETFRPIFAFSRKVNEDS